MERVSRSYVEHVAIKVKDINWYIDFFKNALNFRTREVHGDESNPEQIWLGGIQLTADKNFENAKEQELVWHLGLFTENLEIALGKIYTYENVIEMPQGRNWFKLPNGLVIELMQAGEGSIDKLLEIDVRKPV